MTDQDKTALLSKLRAPVADERANVDTLARVLQTAWAKAEPDHSVTLNPTSYWSTFADMARASLASAPVAGEATPTDDDILVLALDHGAISGGQHFGPAIRFARALLSQYAAPQASEAKPVWSHCVFHGTPPTGFANWIEWLAAPVKKGVFVRAATAEDLKNLPPPPDSEAQCSCPSGDGSLRHPCAVHPQASEAVRDAGPAASEDVAPWTDFAGNPIKHGDRIRHPEGLEGVVVRLPGYADAHDAWCVAYQDRTVSRLSLQIGDRGQAVVQGALSAQPGAQKGGGDA